MRQRRARQDSILAAIAAGEADVDRLAARFAVSPSTIRRDLQHLSARRAVARTYGGAILAPPLPEQSLGTREASNGAAKAAIAAAALARIRDGETLILDGGSTVAALGRLLRGRRLRVITGNLPLIPLLAGEPGIELIVLGGVVRPLSMGTTGPLAEQALRQMTADKAFTSADGVVAERGLCEATLEQAALKALMTAQAAEVFVLADATKLGRAGQPCWTPLRPGWHLVTDAPAAACAAFLAGGLRILPAA
ncbi:DeoR/GlpR family DNA-binding transcription regulator [Teichococcus aestuarii]|uniref:DeoR family transcriptional regulator n=1 Tax=Teichococcus aestuarii TaxID=568898 RepID=A0A2U1V686_9PROT|nr:DeoR/GlpR family DNA-binding transcription regulator [Pseudoroseomonas aestuarii]PWC29420.1 DeoR family transcriptional regulator [Pseudoroseomonas aestuarii]